MTTTTQQPPSNPALDFANSILEVTNNGLELIEILRDIAKDCDEKATTNDRIAAANILTDRAFGKCPKQVSPSPDPTPEADDNGVEALREAPSAKPESPRLVTQIDDALHDSLGPAPSAHTPPRHSRANGNPESYDVSDSPEYETPDPSDPYSIHFTIQQHILAITNNGQMLRDVLLEIARTEDDPKDCPEPRRRVTPYHRRRAASLLLDRLLGTDPNALRSGVCPDCRQKWTTHTNSSDHPGHSRNADSTDEETVPDPGWIETLHEIKRMEDEGIIDNVEYDPFNPKSRMTGTEEEIAPYADEIAAKYRAELDLQAERRAKWPEIEERRRKKLAELYPSHSEDEDGGPPDT